MSCTTITIGLRLNPDFDQKRIASLRIPDTCTFVSVDYVVAKRKAKRHNRCFFMQVQMITIVNKVRVCRACAFL